MKAKLITAAIATVILAALCLWTSITISSIPALDPRARVAAHATATAIAPSIYPTLQYNENVLPELQRVERDEINATIRNAQELKRATDTANTIAGVVGIASIALAGVGIGIGIGGVFGARGIREMRRAALPQTRHLLEGPHMTQDGTITHTVTGGTWDVSAPQDAMPEHARLISPTYQALPAGVVAQLLAAMASGVMTGGQRAQVRYLTAEQPIDKP